MSRLYDNIKAAIEADRVVVSWHADEQCEHRKIASWQVVVGFDKATLLRERPRSKPNPTIVVEQMLADGTTVQAVWAWLAPSGRAKVVTVFFPE